MLVKVSTHYIVGPPVHGRGVAGLESSAGPFGSVPSTSGRLAAASGLFRD